MNRWRVGLFLLLILAAAPPPVSAGAVGNPGISFENLELDLGRVMQGDTARGVFRFRNPGSAVLKILDVAPGCGCTTTLLSAKQINPGGTGEIAVAVNTDGISGAMRKAVVVTTNDPGRPEVTLMVTALVEPEVSFSLPALFFGEVPVDKEVTREIVLTVRSDVSVRIVGVESSNQDIRAGLSPEPLSNGKRVRLSVTHRAGAKPGYFFGAVIIKTTSSRTPELTLGVRGTVNPPLPNQPEFNR